jgi:hypothetical protein
MVRIIAMTLPAIYPISPPTPTIAVCKRLSPPTKKPLLKAALDGVK